VTVAMPGTELAASALALSSLHGRGPGWGADTDDETPVVAGRRRRPKSGKPRQPALEIEAPQTSSIVLLAIDRAGWANLVRLLTVGRRRCDQGNSLVRWPGGVG